MLTVILAGCGGKVQRSLAGRHPRRASHAEADAGPIRQGVPVGQPVGDLLRIGPGEMLPNGSHRRGVKSTRPKKPSSFPGRSMWNRRSRKRLARSHDVSEAITQQWQARRAEGPPRSVALRTAQIGSDEQRVVQRSGHTRFEPERLVQLHEPAESPVVVRVGPADQQPGRRGPPCRFLPGVEPLGQTRR